MITLNEVLKNEGATITTYKEKANLESGYMVSYDKSETVVSMIFLKNDINGEMLFQELLNSYIARVKRLGEHLFVGVWIDNGKAYFDISKNIESKSQAISFGKLNNQLAIYDIKNDNVIEL